MTDRPIAAILAAVAAAMFLAAFSAAAVLRPDTAAVAGDTPVSAPAAATEELKLATIAAPVALARRGAARPASAGPPQAGQAEAQGEGARRRSRSRRGSHAAVARARPPRRRRTRPRRGTTAAEAQVVRSKTFDTSG